MREVRKEREEGCRKGRHVGNGWEEVNLGGTGSFLKRMGCIPVHIRKAVYKGMETRKSIP